MKRFIVFGILTLMLILGCTTTYPLPPEKLVTPPTPPPKVSHINLTISVDKQVVVGLLESRLPPTFNKYIPLLTEDDGGGIIDPTAGVNVSVTRKPLNCSLENGTIIVTADLTGNLKFTSGMYNPEANITGTLKLSIKPEVTPDWVVKSNIIISPTINEVTTEYDLSIIPWSFFGLGDLDIFGFKAWAVQIVADIAAPYIQDFLSELNIRETVESAWNSFGEPVAMSETPPVWLQIVPEGIHFSGVITEGTKIRFAMGVKTYTGALMGEKPAPVKPGPLPSLSQGSLEGKAAVNFPITVSYDALNKHVLKSIEDDPIVIKDPDSKDSETRVTISKLVLTGNGPFINVEVDMATETDSFLDFDGTLYLRGKPVYNHEARLLSLEDFDYDEHTWNFLIDTVDAVAHGMIKDEIGKHLKWNLSREMEWARNEINTNIQNILLDDGIILKGSADSIGFDGVYPNTSGIMVHTYFTGALGITLE